jgi:2-isopropylmalate synthase
MSGAQNKPQGNADGLLPVGTPDRRVVMYDTTLRDGMQGIQVNYTLDDKIKIAHALDEMRIDYIEGGFPLSNEKEAAFFQQMKKENLRHAQVVAFGSTRKAGGSAERDAMIRALLDAETPTVIVVGKTWKAHVEKVLQTTEEENLHMIFDSIHFLKSQGREVFFDLEHFFDGYKDDPAYARQVLKAGTDAGADCLVLCDTNGGTMPQEVAAIMSALPQDELAPLGGHFHNDGGVAIANSMTAVDNGAMHIQGTVNGWGERTGNANLCTFIPNIVLKTQYRASCEDHLTHLTHLSRFVAEKANIIPDRRQPYVGDASFSHKAGQHADVIGKAAHLMEHIDSRLVGNERHIVLSELAGKSTVVEKLKEYGDYTKSSPVVEELTKLLKVKENDGYEYEAAEASFDLLVRKALAVYQPLVTLRNYHLESYKTADAPSKNGRQDIPADGSARTDGSGGLRRAGGYPRSRPPGRPRPRCFRGSTGSPSPTFGSGCSTPRVAPPPKYASSSPTATTNGTGIPSVSTKISWRRPGRR